MKLDERSNNSTSSTSNIPEDKVQILCHALYSIGSMCRYFDFDILLKNEQRDLFIDNNPAGESNEQEHIVSNSVFSILVSYYYPYSTLSQMALIALGFNFSLFNIDYFITQANSPLDVLRFCVKKN